ncbi:MAG: hypothetical protein LBT97_13005 [Planctomycetota bacterium]|jgi:myo-inositol 2-dehydrogenase/D-chiro-inositol 1-dehydrogenase|nr:hypothetical protein [Planctomycetota bacterium]
MQAYQDECKAFVECVQRGTQPPCGGRDGRISVVMGYAAVRSAKENRPVKISEIG